jgi:enediyne polyketide synthase
MSRIAIVGMACRFPDADSPLQLWENTLAGRRAFRRLPDVRLRAADYWDPDPAAPDRTYSRTAAVIEGYEFDRVGYRIAGSTYRSTDLTHWLALDTAARALADAGFEDGDGLPAERTGVIVGNSLTGEFTRANAMRLRWPYVRRTVGAALTAEGWAPDRLAQFLADLEHSYKAPFPAIDEDSLAGGLANTIAGRICNYFDLHGGGYTVDGACSSSLLSVLTACRSLLTGELDAAVAGGVDLSIDPFEMVGFAKTSALATGEMRVYDERSCGFWPGEGCGMLVLMREDDARASGLTVHALVSGWGISSDGRGGITRPELSGYRRVLERAYASVGFGVDSVPLFEGHGTGTVVGDRTELTAIAESRARASGDPRPAAIGSVKGMIGHTKAAAGVAGLIRTAMALREQVLPPTLGCVEPHDLLREHAGGLRALREAEPWPHSAPLRAGVTAMGFGGINAHVVLEGGGPVRTTGLRHRVRELMASAQDAELLLVDAPDAVGLRRRLEELAQWVPTLSYAELGDLAAALQAQIRDLPHRAAVVVRSPEDAERRLRSVIDRLDRDGGTIEAAGRACLGRPGARPRIGFLFPGQGSGRPGMVGALRRRFPGLGADPEETAPDADPQATQAAQPRIVAGSLTGLRVLELLGLEADVAVGHSLGELTALHWAGALGGPQLLRLAAERGRTMARLARPGTMVAVAAPPTTVRSLIGDLPVVVAGENGTAETVVSGGGADIEEFRERAAGAGVRCTTLRVSHAFHSPLMAAAAEAFGTVLGGERFQPLTRTVVSTVTGGVLPADTDARTLLRRQILEPVRFSTAAASAARGADLLVEVGPGTVLTGLAGRLTDVPVLSLDTDRESLGGLLAVVAAAWTLGASVRHGELFAGRVTRNLRIGATFSFFSSPCERAPQDAAVGPASVRPAGAPGTAEQSRDESADPKNGRSAAASGPDAGGSSLEVLRALVAERVELPVEMVLDTSHLLDDLHLSSITVGQVLNQAARELGVQIVTTPTNVATSTVGELADLLAGAGDAGPVDPVTGAAAWARVYAVDLDPVTRSTGLAAAEDGTWQVHADDDGAELAGALRLALGSAGLGAGVLVCVAGSDPEQAVRSGLAGARAAIASGAGRFLLVQRGGPGAAALARTLRQEAPDVRVTIVHLRGDVRDPVTPVIAEVAATTGFSEAHLDGAGGRRVPTLRALPLAARRPEQPLGPADVLLVTGGGKGITAECAAALASDTGAALALLGRSDPAADPQLAANLERLAGQGLRVRYLRADVTDPDQVRRAVAEVTTTLGPVTGLLHGAGRNEPAPLTELSEADFTQTLEPKLAGLRAVLDAVPPDGLKLLVTFASIIGRAGLRGEAHYAIANERLAAATADLADQLPGCRVRCLEWSVWSGTGMGERLAVVETLAAAGITAISTEDGVELFRRVVCDPDLPPVVVVSGRTGAADTIRHEPVELPLYRFLGRALVHYPRAELITEVELNPGADRYLGDHRLDGELLFPAVFGLEAMAQVAAAVAGRADLPLLEDAEFLRPIVVPADGTLTVRIAATVTGDDEVQASIRCAETGFAADHFRVRIRFAGASAPPGPPEQVSDALGSVALNPATDLYGKLLFQGGRFQRLLSYRQVSARSVDADVAAHDCDWFAAFLPGELLLGDPGVRDALMHGNQVCVPDMTLLPIRVERIHPGGDKLAAAGRLRYCAVERQRDGDTFVYDVAVRTVGGDVVERWQGLWLRAVRRIDGRGPWPAALLGSYLERSLDDVLGAAVSVAVEPDGSTAEPGDGRSEAVAARALGRPAQVSRRPDGRPQLAGLGAPQMSAAHGGGLTLAVVGSDRVACDLEVVLARRGEDWAGMLGARAPLAALISSERGESPDLAGTRVWAALECLQKSGFPGDAPLTVEPTPADTGDRRWSNWVLFASGRARIATAVTAVVGVAEPVVTAVLVERRS